MRKLLLVLLIAAFASIQVLAIPARRGFVPLPQPDGTMVSIGIVGDEFYSFSITEDDYTVTMNDKGAYVYVQKDGDKLIETQILAHNSGERTTQELEFLANTPKRLRDEVEIEQSRIRRAKRNVDLSNFDFENFRGLVILIDFADVKFKSENPREFYTNLFSTENLTNFDDPVLGVNVSCQGSVRDYFRDQSNGAFNPPLDVYGPYSSTYAASKCDKLSYNIFTRALGAANDDIDYSQYDNNGDGKVDMVFFLVAGYSAASNGRETGYLWPYASSLEGSYLSMDGKWFDRYACSTELYGLQKTPSSVSVEGIGTVCHEFSHVLGLPDFYDTDYEQGGGQSNHPGGWDVMAGGADYNRGRTPVGYSFFERYALGWANPMTITKTGDYSLEAVNESREGYILRTPVQNEFFTIENRQKTGWDAYLPGHGMIVTRVDSTNVGVWTSNKINCNPSHNYFELLLAGNNPTANSTGSSSDPFPGSAGIPMLTNKSIPNLKTWAGSKNDFNIVDIQEKDGVVNFKVIEDGSLLTAIEGFEYMEPNSSTSDADVEGSLASWTFTKSGVRSPGEDLADDENSVMMICPSIFYSVTDVNYNSYLASLKVFNTTGTVAKMQLEYSVDGGVTWTKATTLTPSSATLFQIPAKTTSICYWKLDINSKTPARFRITEVGGHKSSPIYVDSFTLYYNEDSNPPLPGDVNEDGQINISDVNAIINMILSGRMDTRGDVNSDGQVNISDVNLIISIILNGN